MVKKNLIGILMVIVLIGTFGAGYWVGKGASSEKVSTPQSTAQTAQQSKSKPAAPPAEQTAKSSQSVASEKAVDLPETSKPQSETPQAEPTPAGQIFYGTVAPYDEANIQSKQGGTITLLKVKEGDAVTKGEVLVRFDESDVYLELEKAESTKSSALQQVQQAESNLNTVQTNFERTKKLFNDGLVSQQELDSMTNQRESARASLNSARESVSQAETQIRILKNTLKDFQVMAPISGLIDEKHYNLGEVYQGGSVIYHVINIDQVYVEVEVPETFLPRIKEKMQVSVTVDALGDKKFSGTVDTILPSGAAGDRNFTAKVFVLNAAHAMKPGMFARVGIALE